ncbi:MAG: hypothetical protein FLDDKLPJ_00290 [Phycisphaerae bacterium]|nr:hypothetical protein [Phycisphaerae bacterium]
MRRAADPVSTEVVLKARLFSVERRVYAGAEGAPGFTREVVVHPGAVVILPLLDARRIVMIHNVRHGVGRELLELPAGTLEPGEAPIVTAGRELVEETGYRASRLDPLAEFFMSPGILSERMHAFVAQELTWVGQALEAGEHIRTEFVDIPTVRAWMRDGRIEDAKTLAALGVYFARMTGAD